MTSAAPVGYLAATLVFATFCTTRMVPLRAFAIGSNIAFIGYGYLGDLWPILILHAAMLPMNVHRLRQAVLLDRAGNAVGHEARCTAEAAGAGWRAGTHNMMDRTSIRVERGGAMGSVGWCRENAVNEPLRQMAANGAWQKHPSSDAGEDEQGTRPDVASSTEDAWPTWPKPRHADTAYEGKSTDWGARDTDANAENTQVMDQVDRGGVCKLRR